MKRFFLLILFTLLTIAIIFLIANYKQRGIPSLSENEITELYNQMFDDFLNSSPPDSGLISIFGQKYGYGPTYEDKIIKEGENNIIWYYYSGDAIRGTEWFIVYDLPENFSEKDCKKIGGYPMPGIGWDSRDFALCKVEDGTIRTKIYYSKLGDLYK